MQRRVILLFAVLIAIVAVFKFCDSKPEKVVNEKQDPLGIAENSSSFNKSFAGLLGSYYALKEALVDEDTAKANAASATLWKSADSLKINEIHGDTSGTIIEAAKYFAATISGSAEALRAENSIEAKRKEFEMITDALWSLTRTVQFDGQKVYYQYCPMAFNDKGAYWLSDKREIRNPYFGSKMLNCGEVADSLDYSKR